MNDILQCIMASNKFQLYRNCQEDLQSHFEHTKLIGMIKLCSISIQN